MKAQRLYQNVGCTIIFGYKLTFTQAGTYPFRCVIHPDMEGTVKVGQ